MRPSFAAVTDERLTLAGRLLQSLKPCEKQNQVAKRGRQVSELTTNRLSIYLRCLDHLQATASAPCRRRRSPRSSISTPRRSARTSPGSASSACRGVGYSVEGLSTHLRDILGLGSPIRVAVIGAGNLGQALADYPGFPREGFEPVALFDKQAAKIGKRSRGGVPIYDDAPAGGRRAAREDPDRHDLPSRPTRRSASSTRPSPRASPASSTSRPAGRSCRPTSS